MTIASSNGSGGAIRCSDSHFSEDLNRAVDIFLVYVVVGDQADSLGGGGEAAHPLGGEALDGLRCRDGGVEVDHVGLDGFRIYADSREAGDSARESRSLLVVFRETVDHLL